MDTPGSTPPKAITDCRQLLLWLIPHLDKFPRNRRYTLGERLESGLLEGLELRYLATSVNVPPRVLSFVDGLGGSCSRMTRCISIYPALRSSSSPKGVVPVSSS